MIGFVVSSLAISGPVGATTGGPSGVAYDVVTTCSTGTMTVRADARQLIGTGSVSFSVVSGGGTQTAAVERGATASVTVRGADSIPAGVSVLEDGATITSAQYASLCSVAPADEVRSKFVPLDPERVLDTRPASRIGHAGAKPAAGETVVLPLAGLHGVAGDAIAVVVNITVTEPEGPGFVQAFPNDRGQPGASSNVNVERAGQTIPNAAIVRLGDAGAIGLYTSVGSHFLVDVAGYFVPADRIDAFGSVGYLAVDGRLKGVRPTRVFDTRDATAVQYSGPKPGAGATLEVPVIPSATHPDVPSAPTTPQATTVGSVVLNVTATQSTAPGFVQVAPGGALTPGTSSSLNVNGAGQTIANLVIVPMSTTGTVSIHTSGGAHLVIDVLGYFTNATAPYSISGLFTPLDPERVLDTRSDTRIDGGEFTGVGGTGPTIHFDALPTSVGSVVLNVVATHTSGPGFVQIGPNLLPDGLTFGSHSNLNVERAGQTIANLAVTQADQLNIDGVTIYTSADAQLVADVFGWFTYSITG